MEISNLQVVRPDRPDTPEPDEPPNKGWLERIKDAIDRHPKIAATISSLIVLDLVLEAVFAIAVSAGIVKVVIAWWNG